MTCSEKKEREKKKFQWFMYLDSGFNLTLFSESPQGQKCLQFQCLLNWTMLSLSWIFQHG